MSADPFDTLGVSPNFSLTRAELERQHRELSRRLHPDRYAGAPAGERRQALTRAIEVNEAFRTLRDPVTRGEALLTRSGLSGQTETPAEPAFLMEMMELREGLSQAGRKRDLAELEALRAAVEKRQAATTESLEREFSELLSRPKNEAALMAATQQLAQLRYFRRFLEEAGTLLDEMD